MYLEWFKGWQQLGLDTKFMKSQTVQPRIDHQSILQKCKKSKWSLCNGEEPFLPKEQGAGMIHVKQLFQLSYWFLREIDEINLLTVNTL